MELTDATRDYVTVKIDELERFISAPLDSVEAWVKVGKTTRHHKHGDVFQAVVSLKIPKKIFRAKHKGNDLYVSVTTVRDQLQRELRQHKEKDITQERKKSRLFKLFKNFRGGDRV